MIMVLSLFIVYAASQSTEKVIGGTRIWASGNAPRYSAGSRLRSDGSGPGDAPDGAFTEAEGEEQSNQHHLPEGDIPDFQKGFLDGYESSLTETTHGRYDSLVQDPDGVYNLGGEGRSSALVRRQLGRDPRGIQNNAIGGLSPIDPPTRSSGTVSNPSASASYGGSFASGSGMNH